MSEFEFIEIPLEELDIKPTMEDEFLEARLSAEIDKVSDVAELKEAAKKLLKISILRQGAIRGLCKRLLQYETAAFQTFNTDENS